MTPEMEQLNIEMKQVQEARIRILDRVKELRSFCVHEFNKDFSCIKCGLFDRDALLPEDLEVLLHPEAISETDYGPVIIKLRRLSLIKPIWVRTKLGDKRCEKDCIVNP